MKKTAVRKIALRKETVRKLDPGSLDQVAGARSGSYSCSCDIVADCTSNCTWPCDP